jgi:uncharacterized protein
MQDAQQIPPAGPNGRDETRGKRLPISAVALGTGLSVCFSVIFSVLVNSGTDSVDPLVSLGAGLAGVWVGLLLTVVWALGISGKKFSDIGLAFRPKDALLGLGIGLAGQLLLVQLVYLPVRLVKPELIEGLSEPAENMTGVTTGIGLIPLTIALCLISPLIEEIFFRGYALRAIAGRWGIVAGAFASAILFGLIHFQPIQTPALVAFGLLLAYVTVKTGRLGPAIVGHGVFNLVTVISLAVL